MTNEDYLKLLLPSLAKVIPYQWRVQSFNKSNTKATCVAYVDARQVMDVLDEHCVFGWERVYSVMKESIYCGVGIIMPDGTTRWRWDVGTEGNFEAEKSASSDAFKRAAVSWGVGRFLYDLEIVTVDAGSTEYNGRHYPFVKDANGNKVVDITSYINSITGGSDLHTAIEAIATFSDAKKATEWAKGLPENIKLNQQFRTQFAAKFNKK